MIQYLRRMAKYNQWMNNRLFVTTSQLPAYEIAKGCGQVTTQLFQAGIEPQATDLLAMMMAEPE